MTLPEWDEKAVFLKVLAMPPEQREAYLRDACPDDEKLLRIRTLLQHHVQAADEFIKISVPAESEAPPPPQQIDEFKILRRLGEGGMGVVYLAEDTVLGRQVALKMLARHMTHSEQALARFRDEARNAAALTHPVIVPVHKFGFDGTNYYLVSEYVDGPTLSQVIEEARSRLLQAGSQDVHEWHSRSARIVATIADGLDAAHQANIVHRDLKPSNILLDAVRGPRLTDFGVAKHLTDETATRTGIVGTCYYMSPEQAMIAGTQVDHRSDIFSLGVVLYEMLALRLPFNGDSVQQILFAVSECHPARLRSLDKRIPRDLETICFKAMEKRPQDRYPTAAHVAADLRSYLAGDPILARQPSQAQYAYRFARKHWKYLVTGAVTAVIASLSWFTWHRIDRQRRQLCTVQASCKSSPVRLMARLIDQHSLEPGNAIDFGVLPRKASLHPGAYRFIARGEGSTFSEITVWLAKPGELVEVLLPEPRSVKTPVNMVYFEGGTYLYGLGPSGNPASSRTVNLRPFYMDETEVSNADYKAFTDATTHPPPQHWIDFGYDASLQHRPVVGVTWEDAIAYCRFTGKRLPTSAEWEFAMRWPDGRLQPWGDAEPPQQPQVSAESIERASAMDLATRYREYAVQTQDVRSAPWLSTPAGLYHGSGNVSEFTETILQGATPQVQIKGGSWVNSSKYYNFTAGSSLPLQAIDQNGVSRPSWSMKVGFRCACSAQP